MSLSLSERQSILALLRKEVVPALGCTEPIAVALAAARAAEALGQVPERLYVEVSPNLLKNGMGVVVPGTGECGLGVAAAAGALAGRSALGLECLRDLDPQRARQACAMAAGDAVELALPDNDILLYCAVTAYAGESSARAELRDSHDNITRVWKDGALIFGRDTDDAAYGQGDAPWPLSLARVYDFAVHAPLEELSFILEAARMNRSVAEEGLRREYGLGVGRSMDDRIHRNILSDDMATFAIKLTAAAADARMAGVQMAVMSNSGSGNQGITCTMPVVACAVRLGKSDEELVRALIASHLTSIHIKHHLGRLSAHCGAMVAGTAAACGIVLLLGGGLPEMERTIRNMVGDMAGMICDGAKSSCALKVASAVTAGLQAVMLAMDGKSVPGREGIVDDDIEACIANLGRLGSSGMREADKVILDIMLKKK
ncbi:serine dehydratase subunit alpha family protein [uncultured Desulfovibrio sp.]|uniref:L-cysteine desulfidase family protein n=1 Tax=uncultured Desulfovibrio sp. TaxID=167968 RepID=UPI002626CCD6|nr:L-serine ammonia-lyase, iron-sulfur-dependent, subunit alpha [uncultured Desulfovibrio sp.]